MTDVAELALTAVRQAARQEPAQESPTIRKLFLMMHGAYGNLFVSKFATGEKDANGKDKGIRAAMLVWESALRKFPVDVVETAASRLAEHHPEYPPNLPQFEKLCSACAPRKTYAEEAGLPRLPAPAAAPAVEVSFAMQGDGKDWARRILARQEAGERIRPISLRFAREALGMEGKKSWQ